MLLNRLLPSHRVEEQISVVYKDQGIASSPLIEQAYLPYTTEEYLLPPTNIIAVPSNLSMEGEPCLELPPLQPMTCKMATKRLCKQKVNGVEQLFEIDLQSQPSQPQFHEPIEELLQPQIQMSPLPSPVVKHSPLLITLPTEPPMSLIVLASHQPPLIIPINKYKKYRCLTNNILWYNLKIFPKALQNYLLACTKMDTLTKEEIDIRHMLINAWYAANPQFNPDLKGK